MMNTGRVVPLKTYVNEAAANIAAARLEFEGIEVLVRKDDCGGAYPSLQICRGVRLLVRPEDFYVADRIVKELESEEPGIAMEPEPPRENRGMATLNTEPSESSNMKIPPSQQLDELKTVVFMYVLIAPLLSALFANKIDSVFLVCVLFVGLVGSFFVYLRRRLNELEDSLKDQERRLMQREGLADKESQ